MHERLVTEQLLAQRPKRRGREAPALGSHTLELAELNQQVTRAFYSQCSSGHVRQINVLRYEPFLSL